MDLFEALPKVAAWAWKGKQDSAYAYVRFLSGTTLFPNRIYASTGANGCMITVDQDLPNVMVEAQRLIAAIKDAKTHGMQETQEGLLICGAPMVLGDTRSFPALPNVPDPTTYQPFTGFEEILAVLHACSEDKQRPELGTVCIASDSVNATNSYRIARSWITTPVPPDQKPLLVDMKIFKKWPKGEVEVAWNEDLIAFRINKDELRISQLMKKDPWPFVTKINANYMDKVTPEFNGATYIVDTSEILQAVKRVKSLDDRVAVHAHKGIVKIGGGGFERDLETRMLSDGGRETWTPPSVSAKWLYEVLNVIATPSVVVGIPPTPDPAIRIESGAYAEGIWPVVV